MTQPQITVGILSEKKLNFLFQKVLSLPTERKAPVYKRLFTGMGRFIGKGKNIMNYLSLPNKVHMLSLN